MGDGGGATKNENAPVDNGRNGHGVHVSALQLALLTMEMLS